MAKDRETKPKLKDGFRIVKVTAGSRVWYEVQKYGRFFGWRNAIFVWIGGDSEAEKTFDTFEDAYDSYCYNFDQKTEVLTR